MADKNSKLKVVDEDGDVYCFADSTEEAISEVSKVRDEAVQRLAAARLRLKDARAWLDSIDQFKIKPNQSASTMSESEKKEFLEAYYKDFKDGDLLIRHHMGFNPDLEEK